MDACKGSGPDFTRERKLPLYKVISALLCMEGGSLTNELRRYFGCSQDTASGSAFIQQRQKINEFAFPSLFDLFVKNTDEERLYKGYRLLAADGSDIQIPTNQNYKDGFFRAPMVRNPIVSCIWILFMICSGILIWTLIFA